MKTFAGCQKVADFAQSFLKNWKNVVVGYSAEIIKYNYGEVAGSV